MSVYDETRGRAYETPDWFHKISVDSHVSKSYFQFTLTRVGESGDFVFYEYCCPYLSVHKPLHRQRTATESFLLDRHYVAFCRTGNYKVPVVTSASPNRAITDERDALLRCFQSVVTQIHVGGTTTSWIPVRSSVHRAYEQGRTSCIVMPSLAFVDSDSHIVTIPYQTIFKSFGNRDPQYNLGAWYACMEYCILNRIQHVDRNQTKLAAAEVWLPSLVAESTFPNGLTFDDSQLNRGVAPYALNRFSGYQANKRTNTTLTVSVNGKSVDGHTQVIDVTYTAETDVILIQAEVSHWNKRGHTLRKYYDANNYEAVKQALVALSTLMRFGTSSVASAKKYRNSLKRQQ